MRNTMIMVVGSHSSIELMLRQALPLSNRLKMEILEYDSTKNSSNAIAQITANSPDIVLLDIEYPSLGGLNLSKKIIQAFPEIKVIIFSTNPEEDDNELLEVIKCGAAAYLKNKRLNAGKLIRTTEDVCKGDSPLVESLINNPRIAGRILRQFQTSKTVARNGREHFRYLTSEEVKTLKLIAGGKSTNCISDALFIDEQTIKNHLREVIQKLALNERILYASAKASKDLLAFRIARDGNLLIFNKQPSSSCQLQSLSGSGNTSHI